MALIILPPFPPKLLSGYAALFLSLSFAIQTPSTQTVILLPYFVPRLSIFFFTRGPTLHRHESLIRVMFLLLLDVCSYGVESSSCSATRKRVWELSRVCLRFGLLSASFWLVSHYLAEYCGGDFYAHWAPCN